jgi:2-methylcitrate dehydratase PrpD
MLDGDGGTASMIQVERLADFVVRDSYENLSEEAIRELKMRILNSLRCAIRAPARDFQAREPRHQGSLGQNPVLQRLEREAVITSAFPDGFWGQRGYCRFNLKEV